MKNQIQNIELNRMRSYSSIFSSTYFSKLLRNDDYSFINSKIIKYDQLKIGNDIITYHDYIRFVYKEMSKQYRNEYVYKNTFINELLINSYGVKDTVAINEFRVGDSIADIVLFNGTSKAFEIKTELDSNKRLIGQLSDYSKIFKESYIVTHDALIDKYLKEDDSVGLIALSSNSKSLKMTEIRPAKINLEINPESIIRSIRTNEYKAIVNQYYGGLPKMNSFNMFDICSDLIKQIPTEDLNILFIEQLKKRKSNTINIKSFAKELRQIGLALNIDDRNYQILFEKLNKTIQI
ncbi:sce7726 family protein [Flavobacterium sp. GT3R68]|uniref:sce7726 family protein n=1 Tax=Flavobacterium sp. GT3R68 TaxID=2594437 RepID=UPI000F887308|nr:sce7726 family protein [Flavobacterium sp. GT3R68]RTY89318.1 hypothetical protein EKL32_22950 [Flavobacterium sp. GSN2]TRW93878.1 sce7726 family protein [Flavobacterium sp. GT3R68]